MAAASPIVWVDSTVTTWGFITSETRSDRSRSRALFMALHRLQ
jgi:hypothetical protein